MQSKLILLFILLISLTWVQNAKAQEVSTGFAALTTFTFKHEAGTEAEDATTVDYHFRLGYIMPSGIYFGLHYERTTSSGFNSVNSTAVGNSAGFFYGPASFVMTYFLTARSNQHGTSGTISREGGKGLQTDLSLHFPIGAYVKIGPTLTHRSIRYSTETDASGTVSGGSGSETFIYPYFNILIVF